MKKSPGYKAQASARTKSFKMPNLHQLAPNEKKEKSIHNIVVLNQEKIFLKMFSQTEKLFSIHNSNT